MADPNMREGLGLKGAASRVARKLSAPVRSERFLKTVSRLARNATPIGSHTLRAALDRLIGGRPEVMLMHSSLSNCGRFTAGPEDVLDLLRGFCGTLCLPTHTYCYPPAPGEAGPLFDPATTQSQNGLLTEIFRKQAAVRRSIHATHSLAASGPLAEEVVADHYRWDSPCGAGTPYSRLIQRRASALMFGVTFYSYTFFHTSEFESGSELAYQHGVTDCLRVVDEDGQERDCMSRRQNWAPTRFKEAGDLLERIGLVDRVMLGRGALLFVPDTMKVHDFMMERLRTTPDYLRQSCATDLY